LRKTQTSLYEKNVKGGDNNLNEKKLMTLNLYSDMLKELGKSKPEIKKELLSLPIDKVLEILKNSNNDIDIQQNIKNLDQQN